MVRKPTYKELEKKIKILERQVREYQQAKEALSDNAFYTRSIFRAAPIGIGVVINRVIQDVNNCFCKITGYSKNELIGQSSRIVYPSDEEYESVGSKKYAEIKKRGTRTVETHFMRKDGNIIDVLLSSTPVDPTNLSVGITFTVLDITEKKNAVETQKLSEERFREFVGLLPEGVFESDKDLNLTYANHQALLMFGYSAKDFDNGLNGLNMIVPEDRDNARNNIYKRLLNDGVGAVEYRGLRKDGSTFPVYFHTSPVFVNEKFAGIRGVVVDLTERKKVEDQLLHASKMDSLGHLAGGIAHDFNNILGTIFGYADMALELLEPSPQIRSNLREIKNAAERSADLTQQLLAFARKQTISPRKLDLNKTMEGMLKMLQRLIGENIELRWIPCEKVWLVKIDQSQIDQIVTNLCVNARDAIMDVGKITIETNNIVFEEPYCRDHVGVIPGEYVQLTVSDNGCGMDTETREKIFEPFFTTKDVGGGTGLGLATIYGIVKQNNGFIDVYSEPGQGTTFKIYLPRKKTGTGDLTENGKNQTIQRGHETIMIVEDESSILDMTKMMLESLGYKVITASTPSKAIRIAQEYVGNFDLLLTDVVMPEMNGRDLVKHILRLRPHLKCLFMSGYTADIIAKHGVLDKGVNYINKPFGMKALGTKIREILDSR